MSDTQTTKITAFLDNVGRTIVGQVASEDDNTLNIVNPVVLSTVPTPDNRMSIQLFPLVFREFLGDKEADVTFRFKKSSITDTDICALDYRLQAQYNQIFNKSNIFVPNQEQPQNTTDGNSPNVVKLFEE
jgi:hypothetical protein